MAGNPRVRWPVLIRFADRLAALVPDGRIPLDPVGREETHRRVRAGTDPRPGTDPELGTDLGPGTDPGPDRRRWSGSDDARGFAAMCMLLVADHPAVRSSDVLHIGIEEARPHAESVAENLPLGE
jgi:hypothetical protein